MSGDVFELDQGDRETLRGTLHDPGATTGHVLTVQADKSIKAKPGGGGGSGVQVVTVPVSSAQILDLGNTPVVLVPGTPGNVTIVNGVALFYLAGLVPYLDGGGDVSVVSPALSDPTNLGICIGWSFVAGAGFWDQSSSQVSQSPLPAFTFPMSDFDGQDVVILEDTAAPTLGNGTLLVTVSYFLAPTV